MGSGFPEQYASILRIYNAGTPRQEKSLLMAGSPKSLKVIEVAADMRKLFGSRGGAGRQDVSTKGETNGHLVNSRDRGACATYRKAKK